MRLVSKFGCRETGDAGYLRRMAARRADGTWERVRLSGDPSRVRCGSGRARFLLTADALGCVPGHVLLAFAWTLGTQRRRRR